MVFYTMRYWKWVIIVLCLCLMHLVTYAQETSYIPNLRDNRVLNKIEKQIDLLANDGEKERIIFVIGMSKTYLWILKDAKSQYLLYEIGTYAEKRFPDAVKAYENKTNLLSGDNKNSTWSTTVLSGDTILIVSWTTSTTWASSTTGENTSLSGTESIQTTYLESGIASYYWSKFDWRWTANGDIFDNSKLTAAHKTLPFNSRVKVINTKSKKRVIVRINDRWPFTPGRVIDLTQAAFKALNNESLSAWILSVDLEVVN